MPTTVSVGLSKKIGLPDFGSAGASCHIEFETDHGLLADDLTAFHQKVRSVFVACREAIENELAREQPTRNAANENNNGRHHGNGNGHASPRRSNARRATASQARALRAIADRLGLDLAVELHNRFGVNDPEELSITEASQTIDDLKSSANGNGTGR